LSNSSNRSRTTSMSMVNVSPLNAGGSAVAQS
jgi:hypothetical protein